MVRVGMLLFLTLSKSQKESDCQSWSNLNWQNYTIFWLQVNDLLKYTIFVKI